MVGGFVLIQYILGKNDNMYLSPSRLRLQYNTWQVNGADGAIHTGIQLRYSSRLFLAQQNQVKHVINTWPAGCDSWISLGLKNWAAPPRRSSLS
eukprot:4265237-Pleurochrysis_carterae.AAC.1